MISKSNLETFKTIGIYHWRVKIKRSSSLSKLYFCLESREKVKKKFKPSFIKALVEEVFIR
jgi:hypothetical protein